MLAWFPCYIHFYIERMHKISVLFFFAFYWSIVIVHIFYKHNVYKDKGLKSGQKLNMH